MAHSIQVIDERSAIFNDLDLLVLLGLFLEEVHQHASRYSRLNPMVHAWAVARSRSGPGTIELGLDLITEDEQARQQFGYLLDSVDTMLGRIGPYLRAHLLNATYAIRGVHFSDYPTSSLVSAVAKLRLLLEGSSSDDAAAKEP
jgi:hypothetical protein